MRKLNILGLALCGLAMAAASFGFAIAADAPEPAVTSRVFLPALAGDDSTFVAGQATQAPTATVAANGCAGPRTSVKILADTLAGFDRTPQAASVGLPLVGERPAGVTNATARISPDEKRVVEVTAALLGYQRTNGGGIDLAIAMNPGGEAIIASFPGQGCTGDTPLEDRAKMNSARLALQQACGNPPDSGAFKPLGGTAKVTGVPFWGKQHTNTLGAASGIELGPVLSFEFNPATSCDANASKTPYPTATPTPVVQEILIGIGPQVTTPGSQLGIMIITVPPVAGKMCGYEIWDPNIKLVASAPLTATGPDGRISWTITLPEDMVLGESRVQPKCPGLPTDGSARLTIVAP